MTAYLAAETQASCQAFRTDFLEAADLEYEAIAKLLGQLDHLCAVCENKLYMLYRRV